MRIPAIVLMACSLIGCASYGDIRAKAPLWTETVLGSPERVAGCAMDKLQLKYAIGQPGGSTFQKNQVGDEIHIAAQLNGFFGPQNFSYDLTFQPATSGSTTIALRSLAMGYGQTPEDLPELVQGCGTKS